MIKKISIIVFLLFTAISYAQDTGIIEGIVLDKEQVNEPMAFVSISLKNTSTRSTTNIDGAYAFEVHPGTYTLIFNFPGYEKHETINVVVKAGEVTSLKKVALSARVLTLSQASITPTREK